MVDNSKKWNCVTWWSSARRRVCVSSPPRAEFDARLFGVDEELERVGLLVLLHEAVQGGSAKFGQRAAGGVAEQGRLDDLQGESVIALADERGGGGDEPLLAGAGWAWGGRRQPAPGGPRPAGRARPHARPRWTAPPRSRPPASSRRAGGRAAR